MKNLFFLFLMSISVCAQADNSFDVVDYNNHFFKNTVTIYTDKESCIQYFIVNNAKGVSITPRIDNYGKPMVDFSCISHRQQKDS